MNTSSTLPSVPAAVRLYTGNPETVVCDVVVAAYRRSGYRQLRREHATCFEALSGGLADMVMLCRRDQITADSDPVVAMLDPVPLSGQAKLTALENCEMALYRRKTDCGRLCWRVG